eukprot:c25011_g1_i8 orf=190-675(+)
MISFAACLSELEGLQLRKDMQSLGDSDNANTDRVTLCTRTLQSSLSLLDLILDDLEGLSLMDLILLEQQVHGILRRVGAKKDELILEQLEDIKEEVRKTLRTTNASSDILEKLVDSCPSHVTGSGNPEGQGKCARCSAREAPQTDASLARWVATSEESNCK